MSCVVFLCGEDELDKERRGYARAFARVAPLRLIAPSDDWRARLAGLDPIAVINPDGRPWLPDGIERIDVPTAVFHIDTYVATERRVRWSALYDVAFVFHPGFERRFANGRLLPHAAEGELFDAPALPRTFEVGWVGRAGRSIYSDRGRILRALASRFVTNDIERYYTPEEMADVYRRSKIVVNVSRDDHPQDANMRCFEAMAAGALLVTRLPTELTDLGFAENVHFAGYRDAGEAADVVARWLARDDERGEIARRARSLVLREHTYDARVQTILSAMERHVRPDAAEAAALHFDYHVEYADARRALRAFRRLAAASPPRGLRESWRLGRLAAKLVKRQWRR
ncbi:MAG TPA: glycosyltransferase [Thermoanaerobaculia bacterium]